MLVRVGGMREPPEQEIGSARETQALGKRGECVPFPAARPCAVPGRLTV